ncbi:hypothetical protein JWJ90_10785 [Desulfobulbus rhabdoformis]|uniref:hypothetical protein n=1 Tax=Desulfobulbus rhabdoformis TaxID=34032 RepID=UPI0019642941|nr:hypothetical protein [Desulfobulbus rhabdoformis]MBM9614769.1 hypothetical protein [Desulfobulbus rhabdoformis]
MKNKWYTIEEAAQELKWTQEKVLRQIEMLEIIPSILLPEVDCYVRIPANAQEDTSLQNRAFRGPVSLYWPEKTFYGQRLNEEWQYNLSMAGPYGNFLYEGFPDHSNTPRERIHPSGGVQITIQNIIIGYEELERFKEEYRSKHPVATPQDDQSSQVIMTVQEQIDLAIARGESGCWGTTAVRDEISRANRPAVFQEDLDRVDPVVWTFPEMMKFTGLDRKTIIARAERLSIEFEERPPKRGVKPEKGLRESDLRRIINNK